MLVVGANGYADASGHGARVARYVYGSPAIRRIISDAVGAPEPLMAAGRRAGAPDTKAEILTAARAEFASKGYDGTSMRGVARAAGVDPALIHHYFEGKEGLFLAALEVPFDPRPELARVLVGPREELGAKLVGLVLWLWDDPERQKLLLTLLRSSVSTAEGTALIRDGVVRTIISEVAARVPMEDPATQLPLMLTQTGGLILTRYLLRIEPIASMPAPELIAIYGPIVQGFLDGTNR